MSTKIEKRDAEELLDAEAGSQFHQALIVVEARSACESAYENFRYDESFPPDVLAAYKLISETAIEV